MKAEHGMMQKDNADWFVCSMTKQDVNAVASFESVVQDGWSKECLTSALESEACVSFVVRSEKEQPFAFASFTVVADEANLDALSVHPDYRRKGVASFLLHHVLQVLQNRKVSVCFLEVRNSNQAAQHLYQTLGFMKVGVRPHFYAKPTEDAWLMKWQAQGGNNENIGN